MKTLRARVVQPLPAGQPVQPIEEEKIAKMKRLSSGPGGRAGVAVVAMDGTAVLFPIGRSVEWRA